MKNNKNCFTYSFWTIYGPLIAIFVGFFGSFIHGIDFLFLDLLIAIFMILFGVANIDKV